MNTDFMSKFLAQVSAKHRRDFIAAGNTFIRLFCLKVPAGRLFSA